MAHFGAAYYEQLLQTEDTKYRLSRAHFYDDQFILARTGEVSKQQKHNGRTAAVTVY